MNYAEQLNSFLTSVGKYWIRNNRLERIPELESRNKLRHSAFYYSPSGGIERVEIVPLPPVAKVASLESLCKLSSEMFARFIDKKDDDWADSVMNDARLLISPGVVAFQFGRGNNSEYVPHRVELSFSESDELSLLKKLVNKPMKHAEFVRAIVGIGPQKFAGGTFLPVVQSLKFSTSKTAMSSVSAHNASIGRDIAGQVTGESQLPVTVNVYIKVNDIPDFQDHERVDLRVLSSAENETLELVPDPMWLDSIHSNESDGIAFWWKEAIERHWESYPRNIKDRVYRVHTPHMTAEDNR